MRWGVPPGVRSEKENETEEGQPSESTEDVESAEI